MKKKVAILTLPLIYNYGAILQAYALQQSVKKIGNECWLIDKVLPVYPYYRRPLSIISRIIGRYLRGEKDYEIIPYWISKKTERIISKNTRKFVDKNIFPKTKPILNLSKSDDKYDVYLVGSDQVWRKSVTLKMKDYLFGFVGSGKKKCSYAASFGVDHWEFNAHETNKIKNLFKSLDIITVREDSAIGMLKQNIGVDAVQVLDPTMLLTKEEYCSLIADMPTIGDDSFIFSYILDNNPDKEQMVNKLSLCSSLPKYSIMPKSSPNYGVNKEDCIYLGVEEWLKGFRDCKYVITDSFHGTVFSIIFNKPFFVLSNKKRGNTRLESLMRFFNLEHRIVSDEAEVESRLSEQIDWIKVNNILEKKRTFSLGLLEKMID